MMGKMDEIMLSSVYNNLLMFIMSFVFYLILFL